MVSTRTPGTSRPRGRFTGRDGTPVPPAAAGPPTPADACAAASPPSVPRQRGNGPLRPPPDRLNPARLAGLRRVQLLGCLIAAGWAAAFPVVSDLPNQRLWGAVAAPSYALAGLLCLVLPRRFAAAPRPGRPCWAPSWCRWRCWPCKAATSPR